MRSQRKRTMLVWERRCCALLAGAVVGVGGATAWGTSLRIASYNIDDADQGNDNNITASYAGLPSVLQAIGQYKMAGNAQPIDVLGVEELNSTTLGNLVNALNGIYGAGTYAFDPTADPTTGGGTDGLIYNTHTVQITSAVAVGTVSTSGASRAPLRYQIQPIGYGTSASFYMYVSHYKASSGTANVNRRNVEAMEIRADAAALGPAAHVIFSGDYNLEGGSTEKSYMTLTAAGAGQAFDPTAAGFVSSWVNNSNTWKSLYTESTESLTARDDMQLVSGAVLNQPGLQLAADPTNPNYPYAYQVFGNNGTTAEGGLTNASGNTALASLSNGSAILNDMMNPDAGNNNEFVGSDHLPVIADYDLVGVAQVPIFWTGGTGTWSAAAKWSTAVVPNNTSIKLQIDGGNAAGSVVALDQNAVIQDLALDASDTLSINAGRILLINGPTDSTLSGRLSNAGTLAVGGGTTQLLASGTQAGVFMISAGAGLDFHGGAQTFTTDANFSGGGQVSFSGAGVRAGRLILGAGGAGDAIMVNQSAGTVAFSGDMQIGAAASGGGTYVLSGGMLSAANSYVGGTGAAVGGTGAVTISGGSMTVAGTLKIWNAASAVTLGSGGITAGTLSVVAGTFTQSGGTLGAAALVQSGGVVTLGGTQSMYDIAGVTISGGRVTVPANGAKMLDTSALAISGGGMLDLGNNDMVVHMSTPAALRGALASGYNNGAFNAAGISSTYAAGHPGQGFGAISGADYLTFSPGQMFDGMTVAADDVLVKYTYLGDATLDGVINVDDYLQIDRGYAEHLTGWANGDFNYDNTIDFKDYALIDAAAGMQSGKLAAAEISLHAALFGEPYLRALAADEAPVPEPASLLFLVGGGGAMLQRRGKRRGGQQAAAKGNRDALAGLTKVVSLQAAIGE